MPQPEIGSRDWLMLALCAMCWGSAYTFNKIAITELGPFTITALRLAIAVVILWTLVIAAGLRLPPFSVGIWGGFVVYTLMSNIIPYALVLYGQRETASGLAAVIGSTTPLFTILLMRLVRGDQVLDMRKLLAILMGIGGVGLVFGPTLLEGWTSGTESKLALLSAAMLYAIAAIYARRFMHLDPRMISAMLMTAGLMVSVPLASVFEQPWRAGWPSAEVTGAVVLLSVIGTASASLLFFAVFKRQGPTVTMLVTLLVPVTPLVLGAILFGERLSGREALGALVIALSLIVIDGRVFKAWRR